MSYRLILLTEGLNHQRGGVQRISHAAYEVLKKDSQKAIIWSSNDTNEGLRASEGNLTVECFNKDYLKMGWKALVASLPADCDKIVCWHIALAPIAAILSKRLRCPFYVFLHGVEVWRKLKTAQSWALSQVSGFAANSQFTLDRFRKLHPQYAHIKGEVLSLGLSESFVRGSQGRGGEGTKGQGDGKRGPFFLTVTRLDEAYKGIRTLIHAFERVRRAHPNVQLRIVGDGSMRAELEEYAKSLNLESSVLFLGSISDGELSQLYPESLAFVLLSEGEGFGIVYLEAMFHGVPCISTNADAAQELVKNNETGFTVNPGDDSATADIMQRLIEDGGLRRQLGDEGRKRVVSGYMPEHFGERLKRFMSI